MIEITGNTLTVEEVIAVSRQKTEAAAFNEEVSERMLAPEKV